MASPSTPARPGIEASAADVPPSGSGLVSNRLRPVAVGVLGGAATLLGAAGAFQVFAPARLAAPAPAPFPSTATSAPNILDASAMTPAPLRFKPLAPVDAYRTNAAIPDSRIPDPAATPFVLVGDTSVQTRNIGCLAAAVYYEAASESLEGQRAVAQVVLNRLNDSRFPKTVCGVVFQGSARTTGCQFSFTCDGSLRRRPAALPWRRAQAVAEAALNGYVMTAIGHATHYHTVWVTPYWSPSLVKWGRIGAHIFYRWAGGGADARPPATIAPSAEPADVAEAAEAMPNAPLPVERTLTSSASASGDEAAVRQETVAPSVAVPVVQAQVEPPAPVVVPEPYRAAPRRAVLDSPAFARRDQGGPHG